MKQKIAITALTSISPLGTSPDVIWQNYLSDTTLISKKEFNSKNQFVAVIPYEIRKDLERLRKSAIKYKALDETVLLAILVSRQAIANAGWKEGDAFGINIGSSRGATQLFEKHHQEFLETGKTATLTSPTTTLGNISSWVAHDLKSSGPEISHSITCSTALHAVLNAIAWLQSGMATKFLVGGSEAPLTTFTIAQMHALKIYSNPNYCHPEHGEWACKAFDLQKTKNTMVLGEGAAVACLEVGATKNALAYIAGIGYATDDIEHNISISAATSSPGCAACTITRGFSSARWDWARAGTIATLPAAITATSHASAARTVRQRIRHSPKFLKIVPDKRKRSQSSANPRRYSASLIFRGGAGCRRHSCKNDIRLQWHAHRPCASRPGP